jgi:hypothetical protein
MSYVSITEHQTFAKAVKASMDTQFQKAADELPK